MTSPSELSQIVERAVNEHTKKRVDELMQECIKDFERKVIALKIEMSADIVARVYEGIWWRDGSEMIIRIPVPTR